MVSLINDMADAKPDPQEMESSHLGVLKQCFNELSSVISLSWAWSVDFPFFKILCSPFRNEDSGKSDKAEKGTKVMRRLSSLRSRVTGSWKDKVRERC